MLFRQIVVVNVAAQQNQVRFLPVNGIQQFPLIWTVGAGMKVPERAFCLVDNPLTSNKPEVRLLKWRSWTHLPALCFLGQRLPSADLHRAVGQRLQPGRHDELDPREHLPHGLQRLRNPLRG